MCLFLILKKMTEEMMKTFLVLEPYFDKEMQNESIGLPGIAELTGFSYGLVVSMFSFYIGRLSRLNREEKERKLSTCPSCGRLKHEVTDPAVCRDLIHYL
jgi:hypothetical protein